MDQARFNEFVDRIQDETALIESHWGENPEMAHLLRVADAISTVLNVELCQGMAQHWNCLTNTQHFARQLYSLAIVRPQLLEALYEDFKDDFKQTIPPHLLNFGAVETHEYPVPEDLRTLPDAPTS